MRIIDWIINRITRRQPDQVFGDDRPIVERWHILPKNRVLHVYLHRLLRSDERALHGHSGCNASIILRGHYYEETFSKGPGEPDDEHLITLRDTGDVVCRRAAQAHRLIVPSPVITLFVMGPALRQWGFHCTRGWTSAATREVCGDETK